MKLLTRNIFYKILGIGLILVLVSFWLWWRFIFTSPGRVFSDMLNTSLRTSSFTKRLIEPNDNQQFDQIIQAQSGSQNIARSMTFISRSGNSAASVTTESIGTPRDDYVRYVDIKTEQKNENGEPLDFSSILKVWAKTPITPDGQSVAGQLFNDTLMGIVPKANLSKVARQELLGFMAEHQVYKPDYGKLKRVWRDGRSVYVYDVEVNTEAYVALLKKFGNLVNISRLENIRPDQYKNSPPLQFTFTIDVLSRQLVQVAYTGTDRKEQYSGFGALVTNAIPAKAISIEELQNRLQNLQR